MTRTLMFAASSLLVLTACSENGLGALDDGEGVGGRIEVAPPLIQYGTLREGEQDIRPFQITNIGDATLRIEDMLLEGAASFVLLDERAQFELPPGVTEEIDVLFTPMGANDQLGHIVVFSNDPTSDGEDVDLSGHGAVPELQIDPPAWDFGADFVGCGDDKEVVLRNIGTDDLEIVAIEYDDPDEQLWLDNPNWLPLTLSPGAEASVWVDFVSTAELVATGELDVHSNDPRGIVTATQTAEGVFATRNTEIFVVPDNPPVDILFAVDQSCSMDAHSAQLATAFSQLINAISAVTSGWQIGVVTTDGGCFNSGVLDTYTSNLQSTFASAVTLESGIMAYTEKLFQLTQTAMAQTTSGCNSGFLRSGALLHLVMVSDEWEQSGITPSTFISNMVAYKGSPSLVKVSGLICSTSGCGHADGYDTNYATAVTLTGGVRADVMATNWSTHAQQLAAASLTSINRYELDQLAHQSSIRVWVDGIEWTSGWHFDTLTNEVVFDVNPDPDSIIRVEYGVLVPCN